MKLAGYDQQIFINCPFDDQYKDLFEAVVFVVSDCTFHPRCSLEADDGGQVRIEKIFNLISECRFGIHDISRTELDSRSHLPRFNMPLELGMFLGAKRYGTGRQKEKVCLILDREKYRYQQFISDIAGHDIREHCNEPLQVITIVRNWLKSACPWKRLPGGEIIGRRYQAFRDELRAMCRELGLSESELTFVDYQWLISDWIKVNAV
jgi:hypothetical protein